MDVAGKTVLQCEKIGIRSHQDFKSKTMTETMSVRRFRNASRRSVDSVAMYLYDMEIESHLPVRREGPSIPHALRFDGETNQAPIIKPQARPS